MQGIGLDPWLGVNISHASWLKSQYIKQKQYCNKFNKDFLKNGPYPKKKKPRNNNNLKKKKKKNKSKGKNLFQEMEREKEAKG